MDTLFNENDAIELKRKFCDEVIESLVAFSNFKGGKVIVGIDEQNKEVVGVELGKETLKKWQNEIKNKTESFITPEIYTQKFEGKTVAVIEAIEFPLKPVSFKNRYFIRKNNSNHQMSAAEVADMYSKSQEVKLGFL